MHQVSSHPRLDNHKAIGLWFARVTECLHSAQPGTKGEKENKKREGGLCDIMEVVNLHSTTLYRLFVAVVLLRAFYNLG